jgi:hypothetical protein
MTLGLSPGSDGGIKLMATPNAVAASIIARGCAGGGDSRKPKLGSASSSATTSEPRSRNLARSVAISPESPLLYRGAMPSPLRLHHALDEDQLLRTHVGKIGAGRGRGGRPRAVNSLGFRKPIG